MTQSSPRPLKDRRVGEARFRTSTHLATTHMTMLRLSRASLRPSRALRAYSTAPGAPLKVAVIGAGPSGFYAASRILQLLPASSDVGSRVQVDMYERLPTPYGLVRYGVAPDHPEVKVSGGAAIGLCSPRDRGCGWSRRQCPVWLLGSLLAASRSAADSRTASISLTSWRATGASTSSATCRSARRRRTRPTASRRTRTRTRCTSPCPTSRRTTTP